MARGTLKLDEVLKEIYLKADDSSQGGFLDDPYIESNPF